MRFLLQKNNKNLYAEREHFLCLNFVRVNAPFVRVKVFFVIVKAPFVRLNALKPQIHVTQNAPVRVNAPIRHSKNKNVRLPFQFTLKQFSP